MMETRFLRHLTCTLLFTGLLPLNALAKVTSYADMVFDELGNTGAVEVALGVPDYRFVNDQILGIGGTSTEVFNVGEAATFTFPNSLLNVAAQEDLILYAWVGGLGETDNATVQVEVSDDGINYIVANTFDTSSARARATDQQENDLAGVKKFMIDFGPLAQVSHVRITNLGGTGEGLRLDAIEGLYPATSTSHAFELKLERFADDSGRLAMEIKNLSEISGAAIRSIGIRTEYTSGSKLLQTMDSLVASGGGAFICVEDCIVVGSGQLSVSSKFEWSLDGAVPAPAGTGLEPGYSAAHERGIGLQLFTSNDDNFLDEFSLSVEFADGFTYLLDTTTVQQLLWQGRRYQKIPYLSATPTYSGPGEVAHFEFSNGAEFATITFSNPEDVGTGHTPGENGRLVDHNQNFAEAGMHVEAFWVRNNQSIFVEDDSGHFHNLINGFETSHGWATVPGLGGDVQGIYVERFDGGTFDFLSLDYRGLGPSSTARIRVTPIYDPALPLDSQSDSYDVTMLPEFDTLSLDGYNNTSSIFIAAALGEDSAEQLAFDNLVFAVPEALSVRPLPDPGLDHAVRDIDGDGWETISLSGAGSSDPNGVIESYKWQRLGVDLGEGESIDKRFETGLAIVSLTVKDDDGNSAKREMKVAVGDSAGTPLPQIDSHIMVLDADNNGNESVWLDASLSADVDGAITNWSWSVGGVPLTTGELTTAQLANGTHIVDLRVTDNDANTADTAVVVIVNPSGVSRPVALANDPIEQTDVDLSGSETILLNASESTSPQSSIAAYSWYLEGQLIGTGVTPEVDLPIGWHRVVLVVDAANGASAATEQVVVIHSGNSESPVALRGYETSEEMINTTTHTLGASTLSIEVGDLLLAQVCADGDTTITCPASWNQIGYAVNRASAALCYKTAEATDVGSGSFAWTTSSGQQSQSGLMLFAGHNASAPIEHLHTRADQSSFSPISPAFDSNPSDTSKVVRTMCADQGRIEEGIGFPDGMNTELWLLESADGGSGPVSSGAALDAPGQFGEAEWTNAAAIRVGSINHSIAIAGNPGAPVANAGADQASVDDDNDGMESFTLDASASADPDGTVVAWTWRLSGAVLSTSEVFDHDFAIGTHTLELEVTDNEGNGDTDTVVITVTSPVLVPPVADAGLDIEVSDTDADGFEIVTLDGSNSVDPDGSIVDWRWLEDGLELGVSASFNYLFAVGVHTVELTVEDNDGNIDSDTVVVTVVAQGAQPPVADAGGDATFVDSDADGVESVLLDGSGSSDPDGAIVSWIWRESGIQIGTSPQLNTSLALGTHTIELEVVDDFGNSATDSVVITVEELSAAAPIADAGTDIAVIDNDEDGSEVVLLDGSASFDPDGSLTGWIWREQGVVLGTSAQLSTTFAVGSHSVELEVTDDAGNTAVDTVQVTVSAPPSGQVSLAGFEVTDQSSNSINHAINVGTLTINPGDLMVAQLCTDGPTVVSCPAGWTELSYATADTLRMSATICYKTADATDAVATSYPWTTTRGEQTQSGVMLFTGQNAATPIEAFAIRTDQNDVSPESPAITPNPSATGLVVRTMCADRGQVTNGVGYPSGMSQPMWIQETNDGGSGPVTGGAAIDGYGSIGPAEWTNALAIDVHSVTHTLVIAAGDGGGIPVADAGLDIEVSDTDADGFEIVTLDGSNSVDPDGSIVDWRWLEDGLELGVSASFNYLFAVGVHTVELTVEDNDGNIDSDTVVVTVVAQGAQPPVADAGGDATFVDSDADGVESVLLDGSGSSDPDGAIVSWIWRESGIQIGTSPQLNTSLALGTHTIELEVVDDFGNSATDSVVITVEELSAAAPIADAGTDIAVIDNDEDGSEVVLLDGSASFDPDGSLTGWIWREQGVVLGTSAQLSTTFAVGSHSVELEVTDDAGNTAVDTVQVTVSAPPSGQVSLAGFEVTDQSSNSINHAINVGTLTINPGDLMVAQLCTDGPTVVSCPAGWTELSYATADTLRMSATICYKTADATDAVATSYPWTTTRGEQTQSGVMLFTGQNAATPIEAFAIRTDQNDVSPESPAITPNPSATGLVVRTMCADRGQVTNGVGYPSGMSQPMWIQETNDGGSGPVTGGAAIDGYGSIGPAEWTNALAIDVHSVTHTLVINSAQ